MNQTPGDMPDNASELFIAGDLHVDVGQQRVTRAGIEITLPYLSFQLLLAGCSKLAHLTLKIVAPTRTST